MIVTDGFNAPATNQILEFDGSSGTFLSKFADSTYLKNPDLGATQGPDGNIYKENFNGNNVLRFDPFGNPLPAPGQSGADFVPALSGGLKSPEGIAFGADGNLYVVNSDNNSVLQYSGADGTFMSVFVSPGSGGLTAANDLHFGPDGHLYVDNFDSGKPGKVLRYSEIDGSPLPGPGQTDANFITPGDGGLGTPNGFAWGADGNLYVSNANASTTDPRILMYDGTSGAFLSVFVAADPSIGFIDGISWGPDGNLYITNTLSGKGSILGFDPTGAPLGVFGNTGSSGLASAASVLFFDDGTGPATPHGGAHHAPVGALLVSAGSAFAAKGALPGVPSETTLVTAPDQPAPANQQLPAAWLTSQQGSVLPLQGSFKPPDQIGSLMVDEISGAMSPANIDLVFSQL
jgi:sugar lactone lactonase YvrE